MTIEDAQGRILILLQPGKEFLVLFIPEQLKEYIFDMFAGSQRIDLEIRARTVIETADVIPDGYLVCLICIRVINTSKSEYTGWLPRFVILKFCSDANCFLSMACHWSRDMSRGFLE